MTVHFHIGRVPVVLSIGENPVAPILKELREKDEVLLLTGARYPVEGELARWIMRRHARRPA